MTSSNFIKEILLNGSPADKRELFEFSSEDSDNRVARKFELYSRSQYSRYFEHKSCEEHRNLVLNLVKNYRGRNKQGLAEVAMRGFGKTAISKLFLTFILQNDTDCSKKFIKVLTKDGKNSQQIVTDIYNLMLETQYIYGDMFEKDGNKKREERMGSFTMKKGVKLSSGTVGQTQRGHIQDAFRPDWIWFDDVEDIETIASAVVTTGIINKIEEAINGLARYADFFTTANYISDAGSVQWLIDRCKETHIVPIMDDEGVPTWDIYSVEDIAEIKRTAIDFYGEYMCDPGRSEGKFFDIERIEADMKLCKEPIRMSGQVKYFKDYETHHYYGSGSDHSEGVGLDSNALAVFDFFSGELVATHADNKLAPDLAAHEYARVSDEYGSCVYAPEVNNKCGGIVINTLSSIPYRNIFRVKKEDRLKKVITEKLGWETNSKTKNIMFMDFKRDYNDGFIKILDIEVLREMKAYNNTDLTEKTVGLVTRHFDLLTAVVIAWQTKDSAAVAPKIAQFYANMNNRPHNDKRVSGAAS